MACGDESADQPCIRHSNCAMGWYCSQGVCRSKTPTIVRVDAGPPVDSGPTDISLSDVLIDASRTDASISDSSVQTDASVSDSSVHIDASVSDASVQTDAIVDAGTTSDASAVTDAQPVFDATTQVDAQLSLDAAQARDADGAEAGVSDNDASVEAGIVDATAVVPDADQVPDSGPLDVPTPDLAPDAGITDRGFGSFPLPSFDMGFGKPR